MILHGFAWRSSNNIVLRPTIFKIVLVFFVNFQVCWSQNHVFWASPCKAMQNHLEIQSKSQFWTRSVRNWTKSLTSVLSGPAKASPGGPGGQVLVSKASFPFFFLSAITSFQFLSAILTFYEIISLIKQIYDFLTKLNVLLIHFMIASLSSFIESYLLSNKFMIF